MIEETGDGSHLASHEDGVLKQNSVKTILVVSASREMFC